MTVVNARVAVSGAQIGLVGGMDRTEPTTMPRQPVLDFAAERTSCFRSRMASLCGIRRSSPGA
jgi:hypothetical protein